MADPLFGFVCTPGAISDLADGWVERLLESGELALIVDRGGVEAITASATALGLVAVPVLRDGQEATVIAYAASRALIWVSPSFADATRKWAHDRGPMTLLVEADGPVSIEDRHRIERFAALLGRQAE